MRLDVSGRLKEWLSGAEGTWKGRTMKGLLKDRGMGFGTRRRSVAGRSVPFLIGAALLGAGCLYVPPPGQAGAGRPRLGIGVTGGWLLEPDKDLESGTYLGGQVSYWMSDLVAARFGFGSSTLEDNATTPKSKLNVKLFMVSAILSLPLSEEKKDDPFRWSIGFGGGFFLFDHTTSDVPTGLPVLAFHGGGEWMLAQGVGRLFTVADVIMGDLIEVSGEDRDLTAILALRTGLEISF